MRSGQEQSKDAKNAEPLRSSSLQLRGARRSFLRPRWMVWLLGLLLWATIVISYYSACLLDQVFGNPPITIFPCASGPSHRGRFYRCEKKSGYKLPPNIHKSGNLSVARNRLTLSDVQHARVSSIKIKDSDLEELRLASAAFNLTDSRIRPILQLVEKYTEGWAPIQQSQPVGSAVRRSLWSVSLLRQSLQNSTLASCCAHVRVVGGKVFFRYGGFLADQFKLNRANDLASFLQATVDRFQLRGVEVELLFNTCDHSMSREGMAEGGRANFLVWSSHVSEGLDADLLVPDFLDWRPAYMPSRDEMLKVSWNLEEWNGKVPKAVFRGSTTNYWLRLSNWVSSPRVRLHRMTDAVPDLLDARVSRWSHTKPESIRALQEEGGIILGSKLNETHKSKYKYEVLVDGGMGITRLCGVMLSDRAVILQSSPFSEFYYPLFKRGRHFMETDHFFRDLPEVLQYMQNHDHEISDMVTTVHRELGWTCSIEGRMLTYAILLVRYHSIQNPSFYPGVAKARHSPPSGDSLIEAPTPTQTCKWGPALDAHEYRSRGIPRDLKRDCPSRLHLPRVLEMAGCPSDCSLGLLEKDWRWIPADELRTVDSTGWWKSHVPLQ